MNKKRTVLVIDEDQAVRDTFVRTLGLKGFEVISSATADEAVDWATEIEPDLIFISLLLPGSNGLKISKLIHAQENLKDIPVIMLTSYQGELDPKYTSTIGIVDVMVKPLNPKSILAKTVKVLGEGAPPDSAVSPASSVEDRREDLEEAAETVSTAGTFDPEFEEEEGWKKNRNPDSGLAEQSISPAPAEPGKAGGLTDDFAEYESEFSEEKAEKSPKPPKEAEGNIIMSESAGPVHDEYEVPQEEKKSPLKKILAIAAAVLVVAGITLAAFSFKDLLMPAPSGKKQTAKQNGPAPDAGQTPPAAVTPSEKSAGTAAQTSAVPVDAAASPAKSKSPAVAQNITPVDPSSSPSKEKPVPPAPAPEKPLAAKAGPEAPKTAQSPAVAAIARDKAPGKTKHTYAAQAGFFADTKNALALVSELKGKGHDAYLLEAEQKKGSRVLVGKYDQRKQAAEKARTLSSSGIKAVVFEY